MQLPASDLRKGILVRHQGRICEVLHWNVLANDRRAFIQLKLRDIQSGKVSELKEHTETKYEVLECDEVELTHSYRDAEEEVFYDGEGNEWRCTRAAAEPALRWPCERYEGLLIDGALVGIATPPSVVVAVAETAPPVRAGRGGNQLMKEATLENGVVVKVSPLVAPGDRIRIDPQTLEFKERA
jgi:elongation factor P